MDFSLGDRFKLMVGLFSRNPGKVATQLMQGLYPSHRGEPPARTGMNFLKSYSTMPWLRASVHRVSTSISATEWKLYANKKQGNPKARAVKHFKAQTTHHDQKVKILHQLDAKGELQEIVEHPFLTLLHDPNEFMTGLDFMKVTQAHIDLVGEAFWLKERDGLGMLIGCWPIPPFWIIQTATPTYPFYRVSYRGWQHDIPDTEMLWMREPDPFNPYGRGSGTAQALGDELDTDEYAAKFTKSFFFNDAKPPFIVYPKGQPTASLGSSEISRLEQDWTSKNQGFWRKFKPYFLSAEVGVYEFTQNLQNMQLTDLRKFERDTVVQCYGIPPELLGILQHSNKATIDAATFIYGKWVLMPRLEFLRAQWQERILPEFDERLILDYVSPMEDDKNQQLEALKAMPATATINEWRGRQGLPPLDGPNGDMHMMPSLMQPQPLDLGGPMPTGHGSGEGA